LDQTDVKLFVAKGDPLAPFLYLIVAEGLSEIVRQVVGQNLLKRYKIGKKRK